MIGGEVHYPYLTPSFIGDPFMNKPQTQMQVGLGEAIERHNLLHKRITSGIATSDERDEYKLLSTALNEIKLDLGFDCDGDGVPDTIEIFHTTAKTSCCRFIPSAEDGKPKKTVKRKSSSRTAVKKKTTSKRTTSKKK